MTDYGHPITFGLSLYPSVDQLGETRQLAQAADAGGPRLPGHPGPRLQPRVPRRLDADQLPGGRDRTHLVRSRRRGPAAPATDHPRQGRRVAQRAERRPDRARRRRWRECRRHRRDGRHPAQRTRDGRVHRGSAADHAPRPGRRRRRVPQRPARRRAATKPDRCHRRRSRSGWAAKGPGCWPSPDAPATAGCHRSAPTRRRPRFRPCSELIDEAARAAGRDPAAVRRIYNVVGDDRWHGRAVPG